MRLKTQLVIATVAAMGMAANAAVVRYDSAATGSGDGSSWIDAYNDIAAAITAVANAGGGEVWVKQGTHAITGGGFALANDVTVMGGFRGEDGVGDATRDIALYETIFAGDDSDADSNRIVYQAVVCDNTAVMDGCTLTKAQRAYESSANNSYPLFRNCVFKNRAGICVRSGNSTAVDFAGCTFDHISGGNRYGIINIERSRGCSFTDCVFTNIDGTGYAIVQNTVQTKFTRCKFLNNRANSGGNVICHSGQSTAEFYDCDIIGNVSTNNGCITSYKYMIGCVIASNTVVSTGTGAGNAYLIDGNGKPPVVYNCSIFDNVVERYRPDLATGTSAAVIVNGLGGNWGTAIIGSTVAHNTCRASVGSAAATALGAAIAWSGKTDGAVINTAFVDNDMTTADVVDNGRNTQNSQSDHIVNCIFRGREIDYAPIRGFNYVSGCPTLAVRDVVAHNYDNTAFTFSFEKNALNADPIIYNERRAGRHIYYPIRMGATEAGPAIDVTIADNYYCSIGDGVGGGWTGVDKSGTLRNLADLATGERFTTGAFPCGPTSNAFDKAELLVFRARVTPIGAGKITGEAFQDVVPGSKPTTITAVAESDGMAFAGWRKVGETAFLEEGETFSPAALADDLFVEAVFETPTVDYTFDLGPAGLFVDNGKNVITVKYHVGDTPAFPAFTVNEHFKVYDWTPLMPKFVGDEDITFKIAYREMIHHIVRYDSAAADDGDGLSWATAMNDIVKALELAGQWTGEVWVKEGVHVMPAGGVSVPKNVSVLGGFAGKGGFANADAERVSRDPAAHPTELNAATADGYIFKQSYDPGKVTDSDTTPVVDGLTLTKANWALFTATDDAKLVFTNCMFSGKAGIISRSKNNAGAKADFYNCTITNLSGGSGFGSINFENGGEPTFTDCLFVDNTATGYGLMLNTSGSLCRRCRFIRNKATSGYVIAHATRNTRFVDCDFLWNVTTAGLGLTTFNQIENCVIASNAVRMAANAEAEVNFLQFDGARATVYGSSIFDNEVIVDVSAKAGANASVYLLRSNDYHQNIVNCTVARNVLQPIAGEGGTARGGTALWSSFNAGGAVNCSFVDNVFPTAELMESNRERVNMSHGDTVVINSLFRNACADYVPLKTLSIRRGGRALLSTTWSSRTTRRRASI